MAGADAARVEKIAIVRLGPEDAADVEELFRAAERRVEPGFLARRPPGEYARLLGRDDCVVVGAHLGDKLIGYSACHRIYQHPYPHAAFLNELDPASSIVYHGGGTVIDPAHQGRMLSRRLFKARREELRNRQIQHFLGLVAVANRPSLGNAVHAGALLIGFAMDETALNYIAYTGDFAAQRSGSLTRLVDWTDARAHDRLFAEGFVVTGLESRQSNGQQSPKSHYFVFRPAR